MLDFAFRVLAAGILMLLSGWTGAPDFGLAWKLAAVLGVYSCIGYTLEAVGKPNAGSYGLLACCDAGVILFALAGSQYLGAFGYCSLIPIIYAARRHKADIRYMAPAAAGLLLAAFISLSSSPPNTLVYGQLIAVFLSGFAFQTSKVSPTLPLLALPALPERLPEPEGNNSAMLTLRENFRRLKDHCTHVEQKGRRDHFTAKLLCCLLKPEAELSEALALELHSLTEAKTVAVYLWNSASKRMDLAGSAGDRALLPKGMVGADPFEIARDIMAEAEVRTRAVQAHQPGSRHAAIILQEQGRPVAMISVFDSSQGVVDEARRNINDVTSLLVQLVKRLQLAWVGTPPLFIDRTQFQQLLSKSAGALVVLELTDHSSTAAEVETLAEKLQGKLPEGAGMWRRSLHEILVFLPSCDAARAAEWANEITALASMIPVSGKHGRLLPLGIRTKVAEIRPQTNEVFAPSQA